MAESKKNALMFVGIAVLILAFVPVGYFVFLSDPPLPPPPVVVVDAGVPEEKVAELKINDIQGEVEIRAGNGEWKKALKGQSLKASDGIRTKDGSYAVLVGGEAYEVRMEAGTEVSIDDLTSSITRLMLESGMATASVRKGAGQTFEVRAAGSDAVARTQGATFAISNNGQGTVAVGAREGEVEFSGRGKVVIVRAGMQSVVTPEHGPSDPGQIPGSLLLKLNVPGAGGTIRKRKIEVSGVAEPGAHMEIQGRTVRTDAKGNYKTHVQLAEGANTVKARVLTVGGVSTERSERVTVDSRVSPMKVQVPWKKK